MSLLTTQLGEEHPGVLASFGIVISHKLAVTEELLHVARSALGSKRSFEATENLVKELHTEEYWSRRNAYASYIKSWNIILKIKDPQRFGAFGDPSGYAGKTPNAEYLVSLRVIGFYVCACTALHPPRAIETRPSAHLNLRVVVPPEFIPGSVPPSASHIGGHRYTG